MKLPSLTRRCAGPGCDTQQRFDSQVRNTWIDLFFHDEVHGPVLFFCKGYCLSQWAAATFPDQPIITEVNL